MRLSFFREHMHRTMDYTHGEIINVQCSWHVVLLSRRSFSLPMGTSGGGTSALPSGPTVPSGCATPSGPTVPSEGSTTTGGKCVDEELLF